MNTGELALQLLPLELLNTLYMVVVSAFFAICIGGPWGIWLYLSSFKSKPLYIASSCLVNVGRSIPFAILMVAIFPFTRWIVGTSIGTTAAIVPLTLAAAPFFARLVESSLKEVDLDVVEAAYVMGSRVRDVVFRVLLPEALPSLIQAITLMVVNLIGYSAMAGLVGGGGLGKVAIQYGYQRFNGGLMLLTLLLLLALVEIVQGIGGRVEHSLKKKRGIL